MYSGRLPASAFENYAGMIEPRDLVEDREDPATKQEAAHHGPPHDGQVGVKSVARCESGSAWSEDTGDDDIDLVRATSLDFYVKTDQNIC